MLSLESSYSFLSPFGRVFYSITKQLSVELAGVAPARLYVAHDNHFTTNFTCYDQTYHSTAVVSYFKIQPAPTNTCFTYLLYYKICQITPF